MNNINIEIFYATNCSQKLIKVLVPQFSQVKEAIENCGILKEFPDLTLNDLQVGIFSKSCDLSKSLKEGDRIEIYRPLLIDPKVARRKKAKKNRK